MSLQQNVMMTFCSNLQSSRTMSFSAPSAINMEHSVVKFDMEHESIIRIINDRDDDEQNGTSQDSVQLQTVDLNYPNHDWQSLSCLTDSTEHSAPINFDMSNRVSFVLRNVSSCKMKQIIFRQNFREVSTKLDHTSNVLTMSHY